MTDMEMERRNQRAIKLRAIQVEECQFFVESSEKKIAYIVSRANGGYACTCGDYTTNHKKNTEFKCKHILAVLNGNVVLLSDNGKKPKLDERFISNIQGKDFVLYAGLLDLAHQMGLSKLHVEALQYPTKDNNQMAICRAMAVSKNGDVFVDVGDANPTNTSQKIAVHILRMASTRAKARALRDFTNIGITCLEELGDLSDLEVVGGSQNPNSMKPAVRKTRKDPTPEPAPQPTATKPVVQETQPPKVTNPAQVSNTPQVENQPQVSNPPRVPSNGPSPAQLRAIENLSKRRGIDAEKLEEISQQQFGTTFTNLTAQEASTFIRTLQQSA